MVSIDTLTTTVEKVHKLGRKPKDGQLNTHMGKLSYTISVVEWLWSGFGNPTKILTTTKTAKAAHCAFLLHTQT